MVLTHGYARPHIQNHKQELPYVDELFIWQCRNSKKKKKGGGSVWGSFKEKYGTLQKKKSTNQAPKKMTLDEVPAHSSWLR